MVEWGSVLIHKRREVGSALESIENVLARDLGVAVLQRGRCTRFRVEG